MSLRNDILSLLEKIPIDFGGGCSLSKARLMADLIRRYRMRRTLDIGVYRGRSLFPQALAHKRHSGGVVYGVDPWSKQHARENDNIELKDHIENFIDETDFDAIHQSVDQMRIAEGFEKYCTLIRQPSAEAAVTFLHDNVMFDLIHIDGNHDTALVMKDVELYLPLLNPGGFLVMDDVSWESVKPAYQQVAAGLPLVYERTDAFNDFSVFWKTSARLKAGWLRLRLHFIGRKD